MNMRPFQDLEQPALMDMLAYITARYTKMFSNDTGTNDFIACRELLQLLHDEIEARKRDGTFKSGQERNAGSPSHFGQETS
jgi:hypothetical protein